MTTRRRYGVERLAEYGTWHQMRSRCKLITHRQYAYYGGRGIRVCPEWDTSFAAFYRDMGPRPPGASLDRIDNNGPYAPGNCRWASPSEQAANRRGTIVVTHLGKAEPLCRLASAHGVRHRTAYARYRAGWSLDRVLGLAPVYTRPAAVLTLGGITKTISEWARLSGVSDSGFRRRLRRGWDPQAAVSLPSDATFGKHIEVAGRLTSVSAAARAAGLRPHTVWKRIKRGWTVEQALSTPCVKT